MVWNHRIKKSVYYKTEHWKERRKEVLEDNEGEGCEECGKTTTLQVHHKNYDRLFKERDSDLVVLCKSCHEELHGKIFDIEGDEDD